MSPKLMKVAILILIGASLICLVMAVNAGTKRKEAQTRLENVKTSVGDLQAKARDAEAAKMRLQQELDAATKASNSAKATQETLQGELDAAKAEATELKAEVEKLKAMLGQR